MSDPIRLLIVDDFIPWLEFTRSTLAKTRHLHIVGEALDGPEAVSKAQELQPDLVLLDIGLPSMNGLEVARQIRKLSPKTKIVFVTQECSPVVVQAALAAGGSGYVMKTDAGNELMPAINAVLRGEEFISGKFKDHQFTRVPSESRRCDE